MSPEVAKKNTEWLQRKKAQREARALRKAHKKVPPELLEQAGWASGKPTKQKMRVAEVPATVRTRSDKVTGRVTIKELKDSAKQKWPKIRGLADATAEELARALEHGEQEPQILVELQETWAKRAKARREAWLKGDSKSAQAARIKQESRT